ncbi:MAG: ATP-binding protein [Thermomicrobiales bacterium]
MTIPDAIPDKRYTMTISRLTVDKLGVKLYDRVSAVLAELVANSYDADATTVTISAPMDELLATKQQGQLIDKGFTIEIADDGCGMTPNQVNEFYLRVGAERRKDAKRGDRSARFHRKVMGRKGVGKLAPFGICQRIEMLTSGGEIVDGVDATGSPARGYLTAHLFLDRLGILEDTDYDYNPILGALDGTIRPSTGTSLKLTVFAHRSVPTIDDLERQLSQRFGIASPDWSITLHDALKTENDPDYERIVGQFSVEQMPDTAIRFVAIPTTSGSEEYEALDHDDTPIAGVQAGFAYEGEFYPVTGWIAYAKNPYRDDLMAGVRIYCRGKIAAQTSIFNRKAGFTGEHDIRSYLVGTLNADWLDDDEDLIQTDRRDILWSHELGQAFEKWGQTIVLRLGRTTRGAMKKKIWDLFLEASHIDERIKEAFPIESQAPIREKAIEFARLVGGAMRPDEVQNVDQVESVVQLSLSLAPHVAG